MQKVDNLLHLTPFEVILILFDVFEAGSSYLTKIMSCIWPLFKDFAVYKAYKV